jgi:hypothetical protein
MKYDMKKINTIIRYLALIMMPFFIISCGGSSSSDASSSDASLLGLTLDKADLDQALQSDLTSYTASVAFAVETISVRLVVNDIAASITLNGDAITSGSDSAQILLAEGANTITVVIKAEDGVTSKTYTVSVTRAAASTVDATLSGLTLNEAELDQAFASTQESYTASVNYPTSTLTLRPVANHSAASIKVNGNSVASSSDSTQIPLDEGVNTVTVEVTAEDGVTSKTYTVSVTRAAASNVNDATLSGLTLNEAELDQVFQSTQESYTASVGYLITSLTLRPVANQSAASITVNDVTVASDSDSAKISLAEGDNTVSVMVTAEDGQTTQSYILEVSRANANAFAQQAYLENTNGKIGDKFGQSVAIDGDTLVVGRTNNSPDAGAVYVFTRDGDSDWTQQAILMGSYQGYDRFGKSVAIDGDTLVVGAPDEDNIVGAVYVFTRIGTEWSQQVTLRSSNTQGEAAFGWSVTLDGDTVVVGAPAEDSSANSTASGSGVVYVFARVGSSWSQQATLKSSNAGSDYMFGHTVALDGDTLVVGSPGENSNADNTASYSGAVYVYTGAGATWIQQAHFKDSTAVGRVNFGLSVALDADTVVVGGPGAQVVYVFTRVGSSWSQQAYLQESSGFGDHVAIDGDTLVVGASADSSYDGAVYVFIRVGSSWSKQAYLKASNAGSRDWFGQSVAVDGDTLVVGAMFKNGGAVYVWQ